MKIREKYMPLILGLEARILRCFEEGTEERRILLSWSRGAREDVSWIEKTWGLAGVPPEGTLNQIREWECGFGEA